MSNSLLPWLNFDQDIKIGVIGDLILDEYLEGSVNRISPEAPVPVHLVSTSFLRAGGAANAALNIQLVGGQAVLFGLLGCDTPGKELENMISEKGVNTDYIVCSEQRPTIRKTRISSNRQQLVRVDWEKNLPVSDAEQKQLLQNLESSGLDAILLSDYGKGMLPADFVKKIISFAKSKNIPVIIDPKGNDYTRYKGATLITPNKKEACVALNLEVSDTHSKEELAYQLQSNYGIENVLITLGAEGMYLLPDPSLKMTPIYLAAEARDVFDVSGAGDTVASIMSLGLGCKLDMSRTMELANLAAGVVVEKWGTHPIEQHELELVLRRRSLTQMKTDVRSFSTMHKIKSREFIVENFSDKQQRQQQVVFTNGCFDILHAGHVSYLEEASSLGDVLIVGVNSDESVQRLKGPTRPIVPGIERMKLLAALKCVDYVVSFDEDTPFSLIEAIKPDVLVKGADWDKSKIAGADVVVAGGGRVETLHLVEGLSTTNIVEKIKSQQ